MVWIESLFKFNSNTSKYRIEVSIMHKIYYKKLKKIILIFKIKNNQDLIGRNAYVLVIVIVDSFEEIGYKELNLDLKFHFNCQILGIFSDSNHI